MRDYLTRGVPCCVVLWLCLAPVDLCRAQATYDPGSNRITLGRHVNTLASIYADIANPAALDYDAGSNTYTLNAHIAGPNDNAADLLMENSTLRINAGLQVSTYSDLTVNNMAIESMAPASPWTIRGYTTDTKYSATITDSDISGGHVWVCPSGYTRSDTPLVITNNTFRDLTTNRSYMLCLENGAAVDAYVYNNSFENVHLTLNNRMEGVAKFSEWMEGLAVDRISFRNCSVPDIANSYGMLMHQEGCGSSLRPSVVSNVTIEDCVGMALCGKEYGNVTYKDFQIRNVTRHGIFMYLSQQFGPAPMWIRDGTIDGAYMGISANANSYITADIYNVKINDVALAYDTGYYALNTFYVTNSTESNYTTQYRVKSGEIRRYELLDVLVVDENGDPVTGATVTITIEAPPSSGPGVINRLIEEAMQTYTMANGHTPLPSEDDANAIALLRFLKTASAEESGFTYTIHAQKAHLSGEVIGVTPGANWYRLDPDSYENTVVVTVVPEPMTLSLLMLGACPVLLSRKRKGRRNT